MYVSIRTRNDNVSIRPLCNKPVTVVDSWTRKLQRQQFYQSYVDTTVHLGLLLNCTAVFLILSRAIGRCWRGASRLCTLVMMARLTNETFVECYSLLATFREQTSVKIANVSYPSWTLVAYKHTDVISFGARLAIRSPRILTISVQQNMWTRSIRNKDKPVRVFTFKSRAE